MIYENVLVELKDQTSVFIKDLKPGDVLKHGFIVKEIKKEQLLSPKIGVRFGDVILDQDHLVAWNIIRKTEPEFIQAVRYRFAYLTLLEKDAFMYDLVLENSTWFEIECWCLKTIPFFSNSKL